MMIQSLFSHTIIFFKRIETHPCQTLALLCVARCLGDRMKRLCLGASCMGVLLRAGCQSQKPLAVVVPKSDLVEPLWLMNVACTNGLRLDGQKVILFPRNGSHDEQWTLDVDSGNILEFLDSPAKSEGAPKDSNSDLTDAKSRTLNRSDVTSITPLGFEPLVLTDRFVFAKRSRLRFSYPHFFHDGEAIVIDRGTGKIIWTQTGINTTVIAYRDHVLQNVTLVSSLLSTQPPLFGALFGRVGVYASSQTSLAYRESRADAPSWG